MTWINRLKQRVLILSKMKVKNMSMVFIRGVPMTRRLELHLHKMDNHQIDHHKKRSSKCKNRMKPIHMIATVDSLETSELYELVNNPLKVKLRKH